MILHKLTMKNFRQFRGMQSVEFSYRLGNKGGKNVTVIFGENGRGKTGIFRAIMFCLYGDFLLSQDSQVDKNELYLVNYPELEEAARDNKQSVESFVELTFSHNGSQYTLKRSIWGMLEEHKVVQQPKELLLVHQNEKGNAITKRDPIEIDSIINDILARGIREYFLFDGEKIERLTRAGIEQRKEISKGLRNLLNIDALEVAIKSTGRLKKDLDAELEKKSTGELARIIQQQRKNENRQTEIKERLSKIDDEICLAVQEKKKVDSKLDKIKEISALLNARNQLELKAHELEEATKGLLSEMGPLTGKASSLFIKKTIERVFDHIDERKQKGEIPSEIRKDLIEKILSESKCICGRKICEGTAAFTQIILWKNRTKDVAIEDSMLELWRHLGSAKSRFEDIDMTVESILQKYAVNKNDLDTISKKLKNINDKIGSSERPDAAKLEKCRQSIEFKHINLQAECSRLKEELNILEEESQKLMNQRKEKEREEGIKDELSKRSALATEAYNALNSVHNEFTDEIRKLISESATQFFHELIDTESRKILRQIVVDADYSVQLLDRWGKPFLANISAGQRQIMSISFIAALAKAASQGAIFEMPLFMDTPFGRLSYEHRKNLLDHVPAYASQWILLATDTEFGKQEAAILRKKGQWGKFYILKGLDAGATQIEKIDVDSVLPVLKDNVEVSK